MHGNGPRSVSGGRLWSGACVTRGEVTGRRKGRTLR